MYFKVQNISTIYSCTFSLMMQFRFEKTEKNGVHIFNCVKTIFLKAIYFVSSFRTFFLTSYCEQVSETRFYAIFSSPALIPALIGYKGLEQVSHFYAFRVKKELTQSWSSPITGGSILKFLYRSTYCSLLQCFFLQRGQEQCASMRYLKQFCRLFNIALHNLNSARTATDICSCP